MKRISIFVTCLGLLFAASACFGQMMYVVSDLGATEPSCPPLCPLGDFYLISGLNASGQVSATWMFGHYPYRAMRTTPNAPINPTTDDMGTLGGPYAEADGINGSGQVIGWSGTETNWHAFRTAPNTPVNPATDDIGTLAPGGFTAYGSGTTHAFGINDSGQVAGMSDIGDKAPYIGTYHAFRTAPNAPINPATDDLGTLGGTLSRASAINATGQVVGWSLIAGDSAWHAFRTVPNSAIDIANDDLGTLGGTSSQATAINSLGQVAGYSYLNGDTAEGAFLTPPNSQINPATDALGTLGGTSSRAKGINSFGQVVGSSSTTGDAATHGFLYSGGVMHDLNDLIPPAAGCAIWEAISINDRGQIAGNGSCDGHARPLLLTPIYKAPVQPPIKADGTSAFKAGRGVLPVKFTLLTKYGAPTCNLLAATIALTRIAGGSFGTLDPSKYSAHANDGKNFRIDPSGCQYVYNLAVSELGVGTYRVDINVNGILIGHAVFALK